MIRSYPSIYTLGHRALGQFLDRDVIVQEKVDGSQFSAQWTVLGWEYRSKGVQAFKDSAPDLFRPTIAHLESMSGRMPPPGEGMVFRGEAFKAERHNTLKYGRCPQGHFVLFDVEGAGQNFLNPHEVRVWASLLGVEPIRTIAEGRFTADALAAWLDEDSALGGTKVEGVVIKPAAYDIFGPDKKLLIAKMLRADFAEANEKAFREANPTRSDIVQGLIDKYRVEARWRKAVQHLRDAGTLEGSPRDIGALIKEVQADILKEEREAIADALTKRFLPDIVRGASGGVAEWYKRELAGGGL